MIGVRLREVPRVRVVRGDPELPIDSVVCDSRLARPGSLFACLRGTRSDGHEFVEDAVRRGAVATLMEPGRGVSARELALLETDDPLATLGALAELVRRRSRARVIGIAGSAGKTSTKDVLRTLLSPHASTVASPASYNNELGVPLTLFQLEPDTHVCVCELGTGASGEVAGLCEIAKPDVGVITAIGAEHLEFLGSLEGVAAAEAELIAALRPGSPVVLPFGEPLLEPHRRADVQEWSFGIDPAADVHPLRWRVGERLTEAAFSVRGEQLAFPTNLRLEHHRLALCAALAACAALGLPLDALGDAAGAISLSPLRGEQRRRRGGGLLINDAYNANPLSVCVALESLAASRNGSRSVAVLGDMAELGAASARWHAELGARAAELGIDLLVAVGPLARGYLEGAVGRIACSWFPDVRSAAKGLPELLRPSDVVLLKASRATRIEQLVTPIVR
jgi:UDP-N-acetylmuramoyl-tripeptide--D-alanyl-D-alanine ligase